MPRRRPSKKRTAPPQPAPEPAGGAEPAEPEQEAPRIGRRRIPVNVRRSEFNVGGEILRTVWEDGQPYVEALPVQEAALRRNRRIGRLP